MNAVVDPRTENGVLRGTTRGSGEETGLEDVVLTDERLTWAQSITKPLRLNLTFDMTPDGDTMTGSSKAGRLPVSRVTGRRRDT